MLVFNSSLNFDLKIRSIGSVLFNSLFQKLIIIVFTIIAICKVTNASSSQESDLISATIFEEAKKLSESAEVSDVLFSEGLLNIAIRCEVITQIAVKANLRGEKLFDQHLKGYLGGKSPSYWTNLSIAISEEIPGYAKSANMSFDTAWKFYEDKRKEYYFAYIDYIKSPYLESRLAFLEHDLDACARLMYQE